MGALEILCIIATILFLLYLYSISNHDFWKIRGVLGPRPIPFFGNSKGLTLLRKFSGDFIREVYEKFENEPLIGIFDGNTPTLIVKDPELIKNVLIKDFDIFADRGLLVNEEVDPLTLNLASIEPRRWRLLRRKLSPVFTSGKLKDMFYLLAGSSKYLEKYMEKIMLENEPIECRELTAKYTINSFGSCGFGIDIDAFSDEDNDFVKLGKVSFDTSLSHGMIKKIRELYPGLFNLLSFIFVKKNICKFLKKLIKDTTKYRKDNNVIKHDFIDLLTEVKENTDNLGGIEMTDDLMAAQAFVFFLGGFETSSTTISNALYELALNYSIQDKLRKEIKEELEKTGRELTYESVKNMKYLHKVFQETLRKYPPISVLKRKSSEDYRFSKINVTIPKDTKVWIPVYAIHRDPKFYPNPETFDPERFDEKAVKSRHPMHYLPFGNGPRNCIGIRFGTIQTKIGLITILKNFQVDICDKSPIPYVNVPTAEMMQPTGGMHLKFSKAL